MHMKWKPGSKEFLWGDKALAEVVKSASAKGKVIGAICLSPVVLARAGVLAGKKATAYLDSETVRELEKAGATYKDAEVVISGNIITARDPQAATKFAEAIVKRLPPAK